MGTRGCAYLRLSRDREDQTSIERQLRDIRAMAKSRGVTIDKGAVYEDVGLSGFKRGVVRPGFDRLCEDVRAGAFDIVMVWKLDRITRQGLRALGRLLDVLDEGGASLVSVTEGIDTSTGMGEMVAGILAGIARQESENISIRAKSAKDYARAAGRPNGGGRRPMGYTTATFAAVVPEEAALLREARDRIFRGESSHKIVADWNERGLQTPTDKPFLVSNLGRLLRSPHLAGLRAPGLPGTWEPIFSLKDHEKLRRVSPGRSPFGGQRLLTGVLRCSSCGAGLGVKGMAKGQPKRYTCTNDDCTKKMSVNAPMADEFVVGMLLVRIDTPELAKALQGEDTAAEEKRLRAELESDRTALEQASRDCYVDRVITREEFFAARVGLEERIHDAEARLDRVNAKGRRAVGPVDVRAVFAGSDTAAQRAALTAVIDSITVQPGHRGRNVFDGNRRLAISWRV